MIFKQYEQVICGTKTQTRRASKPNHVALREFANLGTPVEKTINEIATDTKRSVYVVGKTYAVVPKRGKPTIHRRLTFSGEYEYTFAGKPGGNGGAQWHPCRIRITALRVERLHEITEADAVAEGVGTVSEYHDLWESINGKSKLYRWDANPEVVVLTFEMVQPFTTLEEVQA